MNMVPKMWIKNLRAATILYQASLTRQCNNMRQRTVITPALFTPHLYHLWQDFSIDKPNCLDKFISNITNIWGALRKGDVTIAFSSRLGYIAKIHACQDGWVLEKRSDWGSLRIGAITYEIRVLCVSNIDLRQC